MTGYWQASLKDMIDVRGEAVMQNELSRFSCPLNPDIEYFRINAKTWGVSAAFTTEEGVQDETNYQK